MKADQMAKQNPADSISLFDQAIKADPKFPMAYLGKITALKKMAQYDTALVSANSLSRILPDSFEVLIVQGLLYDCIGQPDKANSYYQQTLGHLDERIKKNEKDFYALKYRGLMKYLLGQKDLAQKDINRALGNPKPNMSTNMFNDFLKKDMPRQEIAKILNVFAIR